MCQSTTKSVVSIIKLTKKKIMHLLITTYHTFADCNNYNCPVCCWCKSQISRDTEMEICTVVIMLRKILCGLTLQEMNLQFFFFFIVNGLCFFLLSALPLHKNGNNCKVIVQLRTTNDPVAFCWNWFRDYSNFDLFLSSCCIISFICGFNVVLNY